MLFHRKRAYSIKPLADFIVFRRRILTVAIIMTTVVLAFFVPRLQMDPSLKSMLVTTSPAYFKYERYLKFFHDEEYTVIAIRTDSGATDPAVLTAVSSITKAIQGIDKVDEVLSVANLRMFQQIGSQFGNFPVIKNVNGLPSLPAESELQKMRKALPILNLMVGQDLKTVGILVRINEKWKFDSPVMAEILSTVGRISRQYAPPGADIRVIGMPRLRQAILEYSRKTAYMFGILCTIVCTVVTIYIFKSAKVTIITMGILGLCVLWVCGLMAAIGIPLNPSTSISFGLILITTLEIVIHLVTRFNQFHQSIEDRVIAMRETVRFLARPILISSATTAVGFGSCMITSIPMVFQLGLIMSLGIVISCVLAVILTPAVIVAVKSLDVHSDRQSSSDDLFRRVLSSLKRAITRYHQAFVVGGVAITAVMLAGAPFIRTDPQILRELGESSPEVRDIAVVNKSLASVHSLQLMLEGRDKAFKSPVVWRRVDELERRLKTIPEVVMTDSFLPFMEYMNGMLGGASEKDQDVFTSPGAIPQVLLVTGFSADGRRLIREHLNKDFDKLRISIRIKNSPNVPILETIQKVEETAGQVMKGIAEPTVTGEAVVVAAQGEELVRSEILSMFIAIGIITFLLMVQMGTPLFGLISLIPNVPPVATVFGVMGWFKIPLDGVTVFAATVSVGLAVDNTIHFVNQLKREMRLNPEKGVRESVLAAYDLAARPMASWSVVTVLGFLALLVTPFLAAVCFGVLVSSAIFVGMYGDLIFMQSIILSSSWVRRLLRSLIDRELSNRAAAYSTESRQCE
jgi:predicted RND superfamily exporter protein